MNCESHRLLAMLQTADHIAAAVDPYTIKATGRGRSLYYEINDLGRFRVWCVQEGGPEPLKTWIHDDMGISRSVDMAALILR